MVSAKMHFDAFFRGLVVRDVDCGVVDQDVEFLSHKIDFFSCLSDRSLGGEVDCYGFDCRIWGGLADGGDYFVDFG